MQLIEDCFYNGFTVIHHHHHYWLFTFTIRRVVGRHVLQLNKLLLMIFTTQWFRCTMVVCCYCLDIVLRKYITSLMFSPCCPKVCALKMIITTRQVIDIKWITGQHIHSQRSVKSETIHQIRELEWWVQPHLSITPKSKKRGKYTLVFRSKSITGVLLKVPQMVVSTVRKGRRCSHSK